MWVRAEGDTEVLEIADAGVGIRPERIPELFEDFSRPLREAPTNTAEVSWDS